MRGKCVLLRADLNVPMADGRVSDTTRIERLVPTIVELTEKGAKVVVMSHFGRPRGKRDSELSLEPLAGALGEALGIGAVPFATECIGATAEAAVAGIGDGGVVLLENLRFQPGEEANDLVFAKALAVLGAVYVNDAFSTAHRAHASTVALAYLLPACAGRLMQAEMEALGAALEDPARPVFAIVGGAKVSTKLELLGNLVAKVDLLMIGGAMANTFLHALGRDVGLSLCEPGMAEKALDVLARADSEGCEVALPGDVVVAGEFSAGAECVTVPVAAVPPDGMILDVGLNTVDALAARLAECRTLLWNGPLGAFEMPPFDIGTNELARAVAVVTRAGGLLSVAGGGDTVAALAHAGVVNDFTYVSTAGGAFLEWMEGKELPGVAALMQN